MLSKRLARRGLAKTIRQPRHTFSTSSSVYNSNSSNDATSIASAFLSRFQSQGPQVRTQVLDANQLQLLSLTLNRPSLYPDSAHLSNTSPPPPGTPIPPGHHLIYFTPAFLESELGADGTDTSYNPSAPFTRRMWAGGEVSWPCPDGKKPNLLRVGQTVSETTQVLSAEAKVVRKTGEAMIVVGVEKTLANEEGVAVVDRRCASLTYCYIELWLTLRRNWVFRPALPYPPVPSEEAGSVVQRKQHPQASLQTSSDSSVNNGMHKRRLKRSSVTLFRFSALTFNPHKIHYDLPWARDVEGHKNIVVHGPLNLISILDFWRDLQYKNISSNNNNKKEDGALVVPKSISYRATSPLYADEEYEIVLEEGNKVNIYDHSGTVAMKAEIRE